MQSSIIDERTVKMRASTNMKISNPRLTIEFLELYSIESNWSFKAVALASLDVLKAISSRVFTEKNW